MALRHGDLVDTMLDKISIDEFEPKTGRSEDVIVVGFYVMNPNVGQDLYGFLNNNFDFIRDIEVSPNPNDDNFYMVFIEIDRDKHAREHIDQIISDLDNLTGDLVWQATTHLTDDYFKLSDPELWDFVITDPDHYMSRKDFEKHRAEQQALKAQQAEQMQLQLQQEAQTRSDSILEFLKPSNLLRAGINAGKLHMQDARSVLSLEVVDYGPARDIMGNYGISESAINQEFDRTVFTKLGSMLGEMKALPIGDYVVIYNPAQQHNVLITKTL